MRLRISEHPIIGTADKRREITIDVDGRRVAAYDGEAIAAALAAAGIKVFRTTIKRSAPRGIFCAIGRCTDCMMTVDGRPNVRTCVTPAEEGMRIETQAGAGTWRMSDQPTGPRLSELGVPNPADE